jgi:hypothetical protein
MSIGYQTIQNRIFATTGPRWAAKLHLLLGGPRNMNIACNDNFRTPAEHRAAVAARAAGAPDLDQGSAPKD